MAKIYSPLEAEAALCLWEAMIEARMAAESARDKDPAHVSPLLDAFDEVGTLQMRHHALSLGHLVCEVFDLLPELARARPYDWEIVPAVLNEIRWVHWGYDHDGAPAIAGRLVDAFAAADAAEAAKAA